MVSVLDGQLSRTWYFVNNNRKHVISLYHDTITGVRSANLDFQEIRGSTGNSSVFMEARGHRIFFSVDDLPGYLEIKRAGWTGFSYSCVVNDKVIPESTQVISHVHEELYKPKIIGTTLTPDEGSEHPITWYLVKTTRVADGVYTQVHRRFRDFVELNSQLKANFKGNHLLQTLPPLPEKPMKSFTDHRDPTFIQDRALKLEVYLLAIVNIPHVQNMICTKSFFGLMESVREHSASFHTPQLGIALVSGSSPKAPYGVSPDNIAVVGSIQKPEYCEEVAIGDSISKINGVPVAGYSFEGIITRVRMLPRPVIVHFIQIIGGLPQPPAGTSPTATTAAAVQGKPREEEEVVDEFLQNPASSSSHAAATTSPKPPVAASAPAAAPVAAAVAYPPAVPDAPPAPVVKKINPAVEALIRDPNLFADPTDPVVPSATAAAATKPKKTWKKNLFSEEEEEEIALPTPTRAAAPAVISAPSDLRSLDSAPADANASSEEPALETALESIALETETAAPAAAAADAASAPASVAEEAAPEPEPEPAPEPAAIPAPLGWD